MQLICILYLLCTRVLINIYKFVYASPYIRLLGDSTKTPGFELSYIINIFAFTGLTLIVSSLDSLFLGLGIHIAAGLQDLQKMVINIDQYILDENNYNDIDNHPDNYVKFEQRNYKFYCHMKKCIEFHNYMIE